MIAIVSQESVNLNTRSNVKEVKARGANAVIISLRSLSSETDQIVIDDVHPIINTISDGCSNTINLILCSFTTWIRY